MNKKGDLSVGDAAVWSAAMVVLFLFMAIFLVTSISFIGKNAVIETVKSFFGISNNIKLVSGGYSQGFGYDQEVLDKILNTYVNYNNDQLKIKDLLLIYTASNDPGLKNIITNSVKGIADPLLDSNRDCYIFYTHLYKNTNNNYLLIYNQKAASAPTVGPGYYGELKGAMVNISYNDDMLGVKFGAQSCNN